MAVVKTTLALLGAATLALANPMPLPTLVARQDFGSCHNQSCIVATIAGSTGATGYDYAKFPVNDQQSGDCCIVRYFPAAKDAIYEYRPGLQAYCAANGGDAPLDANPPGVNEITIAPGAGQGVGQKRQTATVTCKDNILIFVKGTLEPGDTGITVGPALSGQLDSNKWTVVGVNYDNSFDNDYCLGLPGGVSARAVLRNVISQCPNSNIAMSGYSQGAMVVRNALARAPIADVQKVTNVVTFGDPFSGAKIGQYTGPLHVFCMTGDGVCNGQLDVSFTHLSYFVDITPAAQILTAAQK